MRISISRYHSYLLQNEKTEKSIYTSDHANSITDELSASDSSSDDDIIIDRTEDSKDKSQKYLNEFTKKYLYQKVKIVYFSQVNFL